MLAFRRGRLHILPVSQLRNFASSARSRRGFGMSAPAGDQRFTEAVPDLQRRTAQHRDELTCLSKCVLCSDVVVEQYGEVDPQRVDARQRRLVVGIIHPG